MELPEDYRPIGAEAVEESTEEVELSPFDHFRVDLHCLVLETEEIGGSALPALLRIRQEFKATRVELFRHTSIVLQRYSESGYQDEADLEELVQLEEEQLLLYHQTVWLEGYIKDRQPTS